MNLLKQIGMILLFSLLAELAHLLLPFPIPSSIYGLVFLLVCLCTHTVRVEQIKEVSTFLLEIMPVLFIPAAVGIVTVWPMMQKMLFPLTLIVLFSTAVVMVITGKTAQFLILTQKQKENTHE